MPSTPQSKTKTAATDDNNNNNNNNNAPVISPQPASSIWSGVKSISVRSSTDSTKLLDWEDEEERREKILSLVMQTLASAAVATPPTPQKLLQMNKGLIHILQIIAQSPKGQISTRKLLEAINSGDLYKLIKKAEKLGFIKREKVKNPKGQKGNNMVINSLTLEGEYLLEVSDYHLGRRRRHRRSSS
jgi:hypothetical protein